MRQLSILIVICCCSLFLGCGGSRDRGKNADFDRPKATEKK
jgi:hypothetical protein